MRGYKIYLTKSSEVADIIKNRMVGDMETEESHIVMVQRRTAAGCMELPQHLQSHDYLCVIVKYDNLNKPMYEIVFA